MKSWKSYIAVFVLAILVVSVAPRQLWHDCDHAHFSADDQHHSEVNVEADCSLCDYNFSAASPAVGPVSIQATPQHSHFLDCSRTEILPSYQGATTSRGPPHC